MESIVERLIKVEEEAKKIVEAAKEEEEELVAQLRKEKEEIEATIQREIQKELESTKETEARRLATTTVKIEEQIRARIADMEEQYKNNSSQWCDEIFCTIIGK